MFNGHKVVVTMTSWTKRIGNCHQVVKSILNNTMKPDVVYLNLSVAEFPNKEQDLPKDLVQLSNEHQTFKINWVEGPNTKTMKKVFPILKFLDDDDIIIYTDDDLIFPSELIQSRVQDFNRCNGKNAISGSSNQINGHMLTQMTGIKLTSSSQPSSLVTKQMLLGYEVFSENGDVYNRSADDSLYTFLVTLNGFSYSPCSDYALYGKCKHKINNNFNTVSPLKTMGVFRKNGYCRQNTYITHLLYLTLANHQPHDSWDKQILSKIKSFNRLIELEDKEFRDQVEGLNTMDINSRGKYLTYWYWKRGGGNYNAGDDYNRFLMDKLYDCKSIKCSNPDLCFCGSIIASKELSRCRYIIGAGIQHKKNLHDLPKTAKYLAVRGKITRSILQEHGVKIGNDVLLCDPGLLLGILYVPDKEIAKKYDIGIIAHYMDESKIRERLGKKYHVISMNTDNIEKLAREILQCRMILSSSLHGIIFAHSYGIPAYHIEVKDFFDNGNFKFADYYSSFKGLVYRKFKWKDGTVDIDEILKFHQKHRLEANPSMEEVSEKQKQFLNILPYRKFLKQKFGGLSKCEESYKKKSKNVGRYREDIAMFWHC